MRSALATVDSSRPQLPRERQAHDFYIEERWFVEALFDAENFTGPIYDPACGSGTIPKVALARGLAAIGSDLIARGFGQSQIDFLASHAVEAWTGLRDALGWAPYSIVCNPPFKLADRFVKRALDLGADRVAMLLRWAWAEGGVGNRESSKLHSWCLDVAPLARIYIAVNRVSMPPGDVAVDAKGGAVAFAWFVWQRRHQGPATFHRLRKPA